MQSLTIRMGTIAQVALLYFSLLHIKQPQTPSRRTKAESHPIMPTMQAFPGPKHECFEGIPPTPTAMRAQ